MTLPETINELFDNSLKQKLVELRHDIHQHPELSFSETRTADLLESQLRELTDDVRRVSGTGVVARIKGSGSDGPAVAIRGDIDALPITEETGLSFSSKHEGVMHACGHDVHATWAIGAAHLLARKPATTDTVILLQPAEETGQGAPRMIAEGALDGVSHVFGAHVDRRFPIGQIVVDPGALAASADIFRVSVSANGAHGARPHESADPVVALSEYIVAAQTIVSRKIDPAKPAVVTFGQLEAGRAPNIIPTMATAAGTIRAMDQNVRLRIHEELRAMGDSIGRMFGTDVAVDIELGPAPVINPVAATRTARRAAARVLGEEALVPFGIVNMAAEDFSAYLEDMPGCFMRVGARHEDGEVIPAHSPKFYAEDESIFVGAAVLAQCAREVAGN